jgi:anaerobic selenocysteine-containing dehydrogenase
MVKKSFCYLCSAECGILATIEDKKIIKISPNFDDPVSKGYICAKSQKIIEYQHSPDRIFSPKKRIGEKYMDITWEQAFSEITEKLSLSQNQILYMEQNYYSFAAGYKCELAKNLGAEYTTNVFSIEKSHEILVRSQMFNCLIYPDRENADTLLIVGQNTWVSQHFPRARSILNAIKNDKNKKLIVVDTCDTATTKLADLYIKIRPGTDVWLFAALVRRVIDFKPSTIKNIELLMKKLQPIDINTCLRITGLSTETFEDLVNLIVDSKNLVIDSGNGICHTPQNIATQYLSTILFLINGNMGHGMKPVSTYSSSHYFHYFSQEKTPVTGQRTIYGVMPGPTLADNLKHFNCVIIDNNNPIDRYPNSQKIKSELSNVDLVIVLDSFETETTKVADYILPTATLYERTECVNSAHPLTKTLQIGDPIIDSNNKTSVDILEEIANRLNVLPDIKYYLDLFHNDKSKFFKELKKCYFDKIPMVYYILKNTIGKRYKSYFLSFIWLEFYISENYTIDEIDQLIELLEKNNYVTYKSDYKRNLDINLTPPKLLASLKLNEFSLDNKFILQSGYRTNEATNNVIQFQQELKVEMYYSDADRLGIKENDLIIIETALTSIEIKCTIVSNTQSGLLRLKNLPMINMYSDNKNIYDYFSPQYKFLPVNIRKIN